MKLVVYITSLKEEYWKVLNPEYRSRDTLGFEITDEEFLLLSLKYQHNTDNGIVIIQWRHMPVREYKLLLSTVVNYIYEGRLK